MLQLLRGCLAVMLVVIIGAIPAEVAAQIVEEDATGGMARMVKSRELGTDLLPTEGSFAAGFRLGYGLIPLANPGGTLPVGIDGEFYLKDYLSVGSEFLFLTANNTDHNRGFNQIFYWDVWVKLHLRMPETGIACVDSAAPYFRWGAGLAVVDAARDDPYIDFAMPFAFGFEYWLREIAPVRVGLQMEFATYITGVAKESALPSNSDVIPWLWTVGIRVQYGGK
ncbi:MAG: hypothetical protein O7H41_11835 [Planctomycetota bacterium]|nr:hypothetical protein [Planctomycetota bacterium]